MAVTPAVAVAASDDNVRKYSMKSNWAFRKADRDSIILLTIVVVACVVLFPFLAEKKDRKDSVAERRYVNGGRQDKFYAQPRCCRMQ